MEDEEDEELGFPLGPSTYDAISSRTSAWSSLLLSWTGADEAAKSFGKGRSSMSPGNRDEAGRDPRRNERSGNLVLPGLFDVLFRDDGLFFSIGLFLVSWEFNLRWFPVDD